MRSVLWGYLLAACGFALLFFALAKLVPFFDQFAVSGTHGRIVIPISMLFIAAGGFLRFRARDKRSQKKIAKVKDGSRS